MARFKNVSEEGVYALFHDGRLVLPGQEIDVPDEVAAELDFPPTIWKPAGAALTKKTAKAAATTTEES